MTVSPWKYDVFVSFRGRDLRRNFISHLFRALKDAGISYFADNDKEVIGEEIQSKLFKAIRQARFALVVFSTNYADSRWCLDELVEIIECRRRFRSRGHVVVPIFFDVDPSLVSNLTSESSFAQGFHRLCRSMTDEAKKERWRSALWEAKHLSGLDLRNDANENELEFLKIIVKYLTEKVHQTWSLSFANNAIGVDASAIDIVSLMKNDGEEDVRLIGICGVGGMGKTVVAGVVCDRILNEFDCFVFLEKIGEANRDKLLRLQNKLLHNLVNVEGSKRFDDVQSNISVIKSNMRHKKILLVLDNVTKREQVMYFGADERELFLPGSRILITTRDPNLAKALKVDIIYMAKGLGPKESLQLFCRHAFNRDNAREGYEELSMSLVHYAGGHPLALKKFGSILRDKPKDKWLQTLDKLVRNPNLDVISEGVYGSVSSSYSFVGPYGGEGGVPFDDGRYTGVRQVNLHVLLNSCIRAITADYDQDGCLVRSIERGTHNNGDRTKTFTVKLDYPSEYLTSVSGHVYEQNPVVIRSLTIQSNRRTYGPFVGSEGGHFFNFPQVDGGKINGFHGRSGLYLDSIGARFRPISYSYPFQAVGPFSGHHGSNTWDDGKYTDVRQIVINFDSSVRCISVVYDKHGYPVGPFTHGTSDGSRTYTIKLDHPNEYIKSISGCTEQVSGLTILRSLTVHTSRKSHGPFGNVEGRHFSFPYTGGKIIGFHGRCNGPLLESIGAFYEKIPHTYPVKSFGPFGGEGGACPYDWICTDIKRITIRYGMLIDSISFDYVDSYGFFRSIKHGGNGGGNCCEIDLKMDEYITSISGHFNSSVGPECISSLLFQTNKRILGPFGKPRGKYFALPLNMGKIVGFFGRAGCFLDSIGAHMELYSSKLYPFKSVGLFGGSGGLPWDDGKHANVRKIVIVLESSGEPVIESITFQYAEDSKEVWLSERHGSPSEGDVHIIELDGSSNEYLTSVSGYIRHTSSGSMVIGSLSFQSNKRTLGPYGEEHGDYFSSPSTGGKIIGFYGMSSGDHLDAIGACFEPISDLYPIKSIGPFGCPSGSAWDDGKHQGVREFWVWHGYFIHSILVIYDVDGESFMAPPHGTSAGSKAETIKLDYPQEYLTSISGYMRDNVRPLVINSLTLWTNKRRYGPFGEEIGRYFWYPSTNSKIIGFYGRSSQFLDSIGVHTAPISHLYPFGSMGPFGGRSGDAWDDGVHTDIRRFKIAVGSVINSITIEYDNNGSSVQCPKHGEDHVGDETFEVKLDYPKEYLISLSGHFREIGDSLEEVVQSLTIQTNRGFYGPFGVECGKAFSISSYGGRIIGFHGKSESHLNSIGAHLESY